MAKVIKTHIRVSYIICSKEALKCIYPKQLYIMPFYPSDSKKKHFKKPISRIDFILAGNQKCNANMFVDKLWVVNVVV